MSYYLPYHDTYMTIHQHNESYFGVTQLIVRSLTCLESLSLNVCCQSHTSLTKSEVSCSLQA